MNAERMNMANATAKIEGFKEARPPGGFPLASAPKKIFICSPYRPTVNDPPCRIWPQWESCHWLRICILLSS